MLVNQSDLLKNLLVQGPGDDSWNHLTTPKYKDDFRMTTLPYTPRFDRIDVFPRPTFPRLIPTIPQPGCGIGNGDNSVVIKLIHALIDMARGLINQLGGSTRYLNENNYQLCDTDQGLIQGSEMMPLNLTPGMELQIDPGMINPADLGLIIPSEVPNTTETGTSRGRLGNIFDKLKNGWSAIKDAFTVGKDIWKSVRQGWGDFKNFAKPLINGFGSMVSSPLRSIGNMFSTGFNFIKNLF